MAAEYQLRIIDTAGATQAIITDYLQLAVSRVVNEPGLLSFILSDQNSAITYAVINNQVEVWRRNQDIALDWTREFIGIIRSLTWSTDEVTTVTVNAPGVMSILEYQIIAYYAGFSSRSIFDAVTAERIMKLLVRYNATSSGTTADGRMLNATSSGKVSGLYTITFAADANTGRVLSVGCSWDNLLETLQRIAKAAGSDFDLVKTAATTFDFRFYLSQLGTNRTATVLFGINRGNMAMPTFTDNRINEKTIAIVGGQGEGGLRMVNLITSTKYLAASRAYEIFVNGSSYATSDELDTVGLVALDENSAPTTFSFLAVQAPNAYYGVHYFLGDKVSAYYRGITYTQKVIGVSISFDSQNGESIAVQVKNV